MLLENVCNYRARQRPDNQDQAKHALTPVLMYQLAPY